MLQQPLLAMQAAAVFGERAIRPDQAVAGHHDADRIGAVGGAYGADRGGLADAFGEVAISHGLSRRHLAQIAPHELLELGAELGDRQLVDGGDVTSEIRTQRRAVAAGIARVLQGIAIGAVQDALEADGHRIELAAGGQAGIEAFTRAHQAGRLPDLVITDLGMPRVDGRKVAEAIKEMSSQTPVILLTGWGQRLIDEGEVPPNIDRVLSKPPRLMQLRATISELVP